MLIVIAGATASGKTAVSVELAKRINGEIISADCMQVYKYMDIGTAKITESEKQGIKHYFIDEVYPNEEFSVGIFVNRAKEYIKEIETKGKIPIIAGGTGFYINALIYDADFNQSDSDYGYREELAKTAQEKGADYLYNMLMECDPEACKTIHKNNVKRVIRALEFFKQNNMPISEHNRQQKSKKKNSPYDVSFFVMDMPRERLYERINKRVDIMLEKGLEQEVRRLYEMGYKEGLVSMEGLGYKEMLAYIEGKCSKAEAVEQIKTGSRHLAKRQLTWFRHQNDGIWVDADNALESILAELGMSEVGKRGNGVRQ